LPVRQDPPIPQSPLPTPPITHHHNHNVNFLPTGDFSHLQSEHIETPLSTSQNPADRKFSEGCCLPLPVTCQPCPPKCCSNIQTILTDTIPRQVYHTLLLRLPALYLTRITRIIDDGKLTLPEIKKLATQDGSTNPLNWTIPIVPSTGVPDAPPIVIRFRHSWGLFMDSLLKEWKTLNIVSALMLSYVYLIYLKPTFHKNDIYLQSSPDYIANTKC